jgi:inhibitor of cysteine peptidase
MIYNTDRNLAAILAVCFIGLLAFGCAQKAQNQTVSDNTTIANPASVFCAQNGGTLNIVTAADGSQSGLCVFPNGSQCEEWAYYRGECSSANQTVTGNVSANVSSLDESDFLIMDDSVSNLLTDTPAAPEINEPQ